MNQRNITVWFIVGFLVLVIAGVIVAAVISGPSAGSTSGNFVATMAPAITGTDWTHGDKNAKVSLIEYGDFQCPACGQYYPVVEQLLSNYGNNLLFVFRDFPLYNIHPNAGIAAQAAEAAGLQGKFWDMYNTLYKNQTTWANDDPSKIVADYFNGYAQSLGLNVSKFDTDMNSNVVLNKISNDVSGGNSAQIDHTPTFFVNGKQIQNPTSYDNFKSTLDQAFKDAGVSTATSTSH